MRTCSRLLAVCLAGMLTLAPAASADAYHDSYGDLNITLGKRESGGKHKGLVPVTVSWFLTPAWGADPDNAFGCYTDTTFSGTVSVKDDSGKQVAQFVITRQAGDGIFHAPSSTATRSTSYRVEVAYVARRSRLATPASAACGQDPFGWDEVAERNFSAEVAPFYAGEDPCDYKVSRVAGSAKVRRSAPKVTEHLPRGDGVMIGDVITTGKKGWVELINGRHQRIRLGPNGKLELKRAYCEEDKLKRWHWKVVLGRLWTAAGKLAAGKAKQEVETSNAVIGPRGTTYEVDAKGKGRRAVTRVRVISGTVYIANKKKAQKRVMMRNGYCSAVKGKKPPTRPKRCRKL